MAGTPASNTGYDSYVDGNGVKWKIFGARGSGGSTPADPGDENRHVLVAYVDEDNSDRLYNPMPADIMVTDTREWDPSSNDQALLLFTKLREDIEKYANGHRAEVALKVQSSLSGGLFVLLLIGLAMAMDSK